MRLWDDTLMHGVRPLGQGRSVCWTYVLWVIDHLLPPVYSTVRAYK